MERMLLLLHFFASFKYCLWQSNNNDGPHIQKKNWNGKMRERRDLLLKLVGEHKNQVFPTNRQTQVGLYVRINGWENLYLKKQISKDNKNSLVNEGNARPSFFSILIKLMRTNWNNTKSMVFYFISVCVVCSVIYYRFYFFRTNIPFDSFLVMIIQA